MMPSRLWIVAPLFLAIPLLGARAGDSPQWRGPKRDAICNEMGLLKEWPKGGPKLLWKIGGLGAGYSEVSIAGGRIYTMGERRETPQAKAEETFVIALDEKDGKEKWATRIGAKHGDGGPRSTPTVDGDRLYALRPHGDLVCLDVADGKVVWKKSMTKDFGGQVGGWKYCESILIDGDRLICTPGGKEATIIALDKKTGIPIWKSPLPDKGDRADYSSIVIADVGGQKQYIQFLGRGLVGIKAEDGAFLWRYDKPANTTANCSTPLYQDGQVFAASAYGNGGGSVKLTRDGDKTDAKEAYFVKDMQNHHGGMVLVGGYIYGEGKSQLYCLDFKTGEVMWHAAKPNKGSILYADGRLYYRSEGGPMSLVEANPKKFVELGRFDPPKGDGPAWAHPVIADGKLYLRHGNLLMCYDVKNQ